MKKEYFRGFFCLLVLLFAGALANAQPADGRFLTCVSQTIWLTNEDEAAKIGSCGKSDWLLGLELTSTGFTKPQHGLKKEQKRALEQVAKSTLESFVRISHSQAGLSRTALVAPVALTLNSNTLPTHVQNFLAPVMEIFLTQGITDGTKYIEQLRFSVRVRGVDPTMRDVLMEAKKKMPDKNQLERYGDYFILERFDSGEVLDGEKTASFYKIKNGDTLVLSVDSKRYLNLRPGVR